MIGLLRALYHISSSFGQVAHALPYIHKLGGLVFTEYAGIAERIRDELPEVQCTESHAEAVEYAPEAVLYPHYTWVRGLSETCKHVQIFHGVSDKPFYYETVDSERYDVCLCAGKLQARKFAQSGKKGRYEVVGYPKFDLPREGTPGFPDNRPVVLFAPTWGTNSVLSAAIEGVLALTNRFNVIIKPHGLTMWRNPEHEAVIDQLLELEEPNLLVADGLNLLEHIACADVFIGDTGAAVYEAMLLEKRMLVLGHEANVAGDDILHPRFFWNYTRVTPPGALNAAAVEAILDHDPFLEKRRQFSPHVFRRDPVQTATELAIQAVYDTVRSR